VKRYILGRYVLSDRALDVLGNPANMVILDALTKKHPFGMTASELQDITKEPLSSIYSRLKELKRELFRVETAGKRGSGVKPSSVYTAESSSRILRPIFPYQLAPGNIEYSSDFKNAWNSIVKSEDESNLLKEILQFVEKTMRIVRESDDEKVSNIAPHLNEESCCPNCGINHEAKDFIRALIMHLIDRLDITSDFIHFLYSNQLVTQKAYEKLTGLSQDFEKKDIKRSIKKAEPRDVETKELGGGENENSQKTIRVRILSILKDSVSKDVSFLLLDNQGYFLHGFIDRTLIRDEMTANAMVEFTPTEVNHDGPDSAEVVLSLNDKIRILDDDPSFPKVSELESKLEDLELERYALILTGTILQDPVVDEITVNDTRVPCVWTILGDETGNIRFEQIEGVELTNFKRGDKVRVIGATATWTAIRLLESGSVIKIGSTGESPLSFLESRQRVIPCFKMAIINQEQSYVGVKIVLHKIKIFDDSTVLFLTIENLGKNGDITLYKQGCRIFQSKKQYTTTHGRGRGYRELEHTIPPGIEESGVVLFESMGSYPSGEAKIRLQFLGKQNIEFVFLVKI
jgi:hypothetical protein